MTSTHTHLNIDTHPTLNTHTIQAFTPSSPQYSPTSPAYTPSDMGSPAQDAAYSPSSPVYSPTAAVDDDEKDMKED